MIAWLIDLGLAGIVAVAFGLWLIYFFLKLIIGGLIHQAIFNHRIEKASKSARKSINENLKKAGINPDDYYKMDLDERLRLMRQLDNQELISNGIDPEQFRNLSMDEQAKIYEQIRTKAQD